MIITFSAILFTFLFLFQGVRKNSFFLLYAFSMIFCAYFAENHLGWRVILFSKTSFLLFILFHIPLINIFCFFAYGRDKHLAKTGGWRIPEIQIHTLELLGGTLGAIMGQKVFRHKTKKKSYRATFFATIVIQLGIVFFILKYLNII